MLAAQGDSPQAAAALEELCRIYWLPLYAYVRCKGYKAEEAEDLTQAFFADVLRRNAFARAEPSRGRFRTFLRAAMNHFLANEWDRAHAAKRGDGRPALSIEDSSAEAKYRLEAADLPPDRMYEKRWALAVLERAMQRLHDVQIAQGKIRHFELLKPFLSAASTGGDYDRVAAELGANREAVGMAVSRLRRHYRDLVREEVAHTVASPEEVEDERRWLFRVLSA